jgi:hypothetical protein
MRLELPQNPGKYIRVQGGLNPQGMLVIAVGNPTPVAVNGIAVNVQFRDASGQVRERRRLLQGTLPAGQQRQLQTGLGPFQSADQFRVALASARIAE